MIIYKANFFKGCGINYNNIKRLREADFTMILNNDHEKLGEMIVFRDLHQEWKNSMVSFDKILTLERLKFLYTFYVVVPGSADGSTTSNTNHRRKTFIKLWRRHRYVD